MRSIILIGIAGLCLVFTGLFHPGLFAGENSLAVGKDHNGQAVTLKVGETLRVELPSIGGAGYNWHMDKFDSQYLELLSQETSKSEAGLVGGPVMHVWRFKAKKEGHTQIRLNYYREWEGMTTTSKRFLLYLQISN